MTYSKRFLILLTAVVAIPLYALAQDNSALENKNTKLLTNEYRAAQTNESRITALRALGTSMVDRRIQALTRAQDLLEDATKISTATKTSLLGVVESNMENLADLKTDIQVENDLAELQTLVQSIVVDYRIYAVVLPQIHGLAAADRLALFSEKATTLADRIQAKSDELKAVGAEVSEVESLLAKAQAEITAANTDISGAESAFSAMQVGEPEEARTLNQDGKTELQSARANLREARTYLQSAVDEIKKLDQ